MSTRTWQLTDVDRALWLDELALGPHDVAGAPGAWSVRKHTLRGGLADGVDVIEVDNGALSFTVLPTRGMGLWRGAYRGCALGWHSPARGPVHPKFVELGARGGLGWLTGFDELIVRCGLDSNGAPARDVVANNQGEPTEVALTLHGRIANLPASKVAVSVAAGDPAELAVHGEVHESGLFLPNLRLDTRISTRVGSNRVRIVDEVTNLSGTPAELELLYHCNFGPPFLAAGSRLELPHRMLAPRDARAAAGVDGCRDYAGPTPGYVEQVYWYEPLGDAAGRSLAVLRAADGLAAVAVRFNVGELPAFSQWKNTGAESDGYVTGLEPGTDYPNAKPFERARGRVVELAPQASRRITLELEACDSADAVAALEAEVRAIQGAVTPTVHRAPVATHSETA